MAVPNDCPERLLLRAFLDEESAIDASTGWTREQLESHVNDCESCQNSIEHLVAGKESWEGTAKQLAELDQQSDSSLQTTGLKDLIEREKQHRPEDLGLDSNEETKESLGSIRLDFLKPSEQPDSRGRLGSYEVLETVGRGGMGLVVKAYDPSLRRIVAIKVMASHLASSTAARKRFVREARATAAICHEHVVAIYAVEEDHDPPFLVMQFVNGKTLQERLIGSGPMSVTEILRIGQQMASGMAAAHAQGLVHRDIKPANILLENGVERVKITDFGLARAIDDVSMTRTGIVAGTPQFMAPEQANGDTIDLRSDLFSLGSVLYLLCVGRPPFRATTTMGLLKRICEESPRPIRDLNPDIPEWLEAIVSKLLRKKPSERFQTATEVADLLEHWLAHVQRPMSVPAPAVIQSSPVITEIIAPPEPPVSERKDSPGLIRQFLQFPFSDSYSRWLPFSGDIQKSFDLATTTLTSKGFALEHRTASRLRFTSSGPSFTQVVALRSAYSIELKHERGSIQLNAQLQPVPTLYGLIFVFGAMCVVACYVLYFSLGRERPFGFAILTIAAYCGFVIALGIDRERKLRELFEDFLRNITIVGNERFETSEPSARTSGERHQLGPGSGSIASLTKSSWQPVNLNRSRYVRTVPFQGNAEKSFDYTMAYLMSNGFLLRSRSSVCLRLDRLRPPLIEKSSFDPIYSIEFLVDSSNFLMDVRHQRNPILHGLVLGFVAATCRFFCRTQFSSYYTPAAVEQLSFASLIMFVAVVLLTVISVRQRLRLHATLDHLFQNAVLVGEIERAVPWDMAYTQRAN